MQVHLSKISDETLQHSQISKDFLVRYELISELKNFMINRFITVSFPDPYPDDDLNIIGSVDDTPDDL